MSIRQKWGIVFLFVLLWVTPAIGEEQYLIVPVSSLEIAVPDDQKESFEQIGWGNWAHVSSVTFDTPGGRGYVCNNVPEIFQRFDRHVLNDILQAKPRSTRNAEDAPVWKRFSDDLEAMDRNEAFLVVVIGREVPKPISFHVENPQNAMRREIFDRIQCRLDWNKLASGVNRDFAKAMFFLAEREYYEQASHSQPGSVFFAHWAHEAEKKLLTLCEITAKTDHQVNPSENTFNARQGNGLLRSFDLLSGGRAIAQNLELDATVNAWKQEERTIPVEGITGITVAEIDWEPLLKDLPETKLDRLASYIPADQHLIIFPDFSSALKFAKLTEKSGIPVLQFLDYRSTSSDKRTFQRYQTQLGLSMDALTEQLGPTVIDSVAVTGGDLYFPTGTDITILFETPSSDVLGKLLFAKMKHHFSANKSVQGGRGTINNVNYLSFTNTDRTASAYIAIIDANTVGVSNSLVSLERIIDTKLKTNESLADLDEYRFFRNRYKAGDDSESVFAFLSDATIRRWCGPKWRIAASRRLWQQAIIGRLQAEHFSDIVGGKITESRPLTWKNQTTQAQDPQLLAETEYLLTPGGVLNQAFGTFRFLTPITEMDIRKISKTEQDAYNLWREEYEGRWRRNFDPIGIRITLNEKTMTSDVTVMPINVRTNREFEQMFGFSAGSEFAVDQSVYGTPLQGMISLNINSEQFLRHANFAEQMAMGVSLGWIGSHATIVFEEDSFWHELLDAEGLDAPLKFLLEEGNISRLPVAVEIGSNNPLKLAAFLTGIRTMVEQSAPGLVRWQTLKYKEVSYVKVSAQTDEEFFELPDDLALYYTPVGGKLFLTLSETVLKRYIDRREKSQDTEGTESSPKPFHWLGQNIALHLDERAIPILDKLYLGSIFSNLEDVAWRNIPILNEYKRRLPDCDPFEVHEQLWGERLFCPNNGTYSWNETLRTFEPELGELPKNSPIVHLKEANLGVTFENEGIRARVQLELK